MISGPSLSETALPTHLQSLTKIVTSPALAPFTVARSPLCPCASQASVPHLLLPAATRVPVRAAAVHHRHPNHWRAESQRSAPACSPADACDRSTTTPAHLPIVLLGPSAIVHTCKGRAAYEYCGVHELVLSARNYRAQLSCSHCPRPLSPCSPCQARSQLPAFAALPAC